MNANELIDLILYQDIHEVPLKTLGDQYNEKLLEIFDTEQMTRISLAATIKDLIDSKRLKIV